MPKSTNENKRHAKASARDRQKTKNSTDILREQMLEILGFDNEVAKIEEKKKKYEESWKKQMGRVLSKYDKNSLVYKGSKLSVHDIRAFRKRETMKEKLYSLKKLIMDTNYLLNIDVEDLLETYRITRKRLDDWGLPAVKKKDAKSLEIEKLRNEVRELNERLANSKLGEQPKKLQPSPLDTRLDRYIENSKPTAQSVICLPDDSGRTGKPVLQLTEKPAQKQQTTQTSPSESEGTSAAQRSVPRQATSANRVAQTYDLTGKEIIKRMYKSLEEADYYPSDESDFFKYYGLLADLGDRYKEAFPNLEDSDILEINKHAEWLDSHKHEKRLPKFLNPLKNYKRKYIVFRNEEGEQETERGTVKITNTLARMYEIKDGDNVCLQSLSNRMVGNMLLGMYSEPEFRTKAFRAVVRKSSMKIKVGDQFYQRRDAVSFNKEDLPEYVYCGFYSKDPERIKTGMWKSLEEVRENAFDHSFYIEKVN